MPTRDNDTERNVRIEQDESARKNGRNGKHLMVEAAAPRGDNSVEKSLEEFIARANSTFLDADGWDLTPEPAPEPPVAKGETRSGIGPAPEPEVPARVAATTVAAADVAKAVAATAAVAEDAPIAPTDATHVVAREAVGVPPVVITRTSWGGIFVAFLLGGGLVFGGMRFMQKKASPEAPAATQAAAAPAEAQPVKPKTSAAPAEEVTAVQPEAQPAGQPGAPGADPTAAQPTAPGAETQPGETAAAPPQGTVVQPLVQPLPEVKGSEPVAVAPKVEPKKAEPKKATPKKGEPKKATAKGGIVDPFGEAEAPKKDPPKKKTPPKKKDAPKGGIVDPFAT